MLLEQVNQMIAENVVLRTGKGSPIKRSRWGVGKDIGGSLYVHIDYVPDEFKQDVYTAQEAVEDMHGGFMPNIVRIDYRKGSMAFYQSDEFDHVHEPAAGFMIGVAADGTLAKPRMVKQIWHHKWLWVGDDYRGFDVQEAIDRSAEWLAQDVPEDPIPYARIGNRAVWNAWLYDHGLTESVTEAKKLLTKNFTTFDHGDSRGAQVTVNGVEYIIFVGDEPAFDYADEDVYEYYVSVFPLGKRGSVDWDDKYEYDEGVFGEVLKAVEKAVDKFRKDDHVSDIRFNLEFKKNKHQAKYEKQFKAFVRQYAKKLKGKAKYQKTSYAFNTMNVSGMPVPFKKNPMK